jgi:hypothetical protein
MKPANEFSGASAPGGGREIVFHTDDRQEVVLRMPGRNSTCPWRSCRRPHGGRRANQHNGGDFPVVGCSRLHGKGGRQVLQLCVSRTEALHFKFAKGNSTTP